MTTLREAAQQALEALENCTSEHGHRCNRCDSEVDEGGRVVTALRDALAQEEQEPVAWMSRGKELLEFSRPDTVYGSHTIPLYTHPPRREWQWLTEEEIRAAYGKDLNYRDGDYERFARAIEAKLKEKNA